MPSRRAVIVSSCEPCASATSKSRPLAQRRSAPQPRAQLPRLADARPAAVVADHRRRHAVLLDQLQRLRVVARRDLDLVAARLEQLDERPEDERMRARRHVDPDPHASDDSRAETSRRDALDVALVPEREREQAPELAREVLAARRRGRRARASRPRAGGSPAGAASRATASRGRTARARRAARPRPGSRSRASARARPRAAAAARPPCAAAASSTSPRTLCRAGSEKAKFETTVSRNGTRASSDHAIEARSVFTSRSSTR